MNNTLIILVSGAMIGIALFWFILLFGDAVRTRRLRKHYDAYKDLSKQGEQQRINKGGNVFGRTTNSNTGGYGKDTYGEYASKGQNSTRRQELLQTATPSAVGINKPTLIENSNSPRKTSPRPRNIFEALRRARN